MENIVKSLSLTKQSVYLYRILSAILKKPKLLFLLAKDFIECPAFYQGEITNTAPYEARITLIKSLNNK